MISLLYILICSGPLLIGTVSGEGVSWQQAETQFRASLKVMAGPYRRIDELVVFALPLKTPFHDASPEGFLGIGSLRLFEIQAGVPRDTPFDYAEEKLLFRIAGNTAPLKSRLFHLYFNVLKSEPKVSERLGRVLKVGEAVPGRNLVKNPSFELPFMDAAGRVLTIEQVNKLEARNLVEDGRMEVGKWSLAASKPPGQIVIKKDVGRAGNGLMIEKAAKGVTVFASSEIFKTSPGKLYHFRIWRRVESMEEGTVEPRFLFLKADKKTVVKKFRAYSLDKPSTEWQPMSYQGVAPEGAVYGQIQLQGTKLAKSRWFFDDCEVFEPVRIPKWRRIYHYADPEMELRPFEDEGRRAVRLSTSSLGRRCTATLVSERFPIKPQTRYIGGCEVKLIRPAAVVLSFRVYDKDGKRAMKSHSAFMAGASRGEPGRWCSARGGTRTLPGAVWGEIVVSVGWGQGVALFDDVFLKEAPGGQPIKVKVIRVEKR